MGQTLDVFPKGFSTRVTSCKCFSAYFTINNRFADVVISCGLLMQNFFNISIVNLKIKVASVAR